jgi:predicted enzyme related to lactoylglutathione lyase
MYATSRSDVIQGLYAGSIHVTDIRRTREFYREVLGLDELSFDATTGRATFARPGTPAILRRHVQGPGEGGREPGTVSGIRFRHADPIAAWAEIQRRGGTVANEPRTLEAPSGRFVRGVVADPDGNEFIIPDRTDQ